MKPQRAVVSSNNRLLQIFMKIDISDVRFSHCLAGDSGGAIYVEQHNNQATPQGEFEDISVNLQNVQASNVWAPNVGFLHVVANCSSLNNKNNNQSSQSTCGVSFERVSIRNRLADLLQYPLNNGGGSTAETGDNQTTSSSSG